eukprot:scaffold1522_cov340-Prasinococcus_capsulatus_cf.AAC.3
MAWVATPVAEVLVDLYVVCLYDRVGRRYKAWHPDWLGDSLQPLASQRKLGTRGDCHRGHLVQSGLSQGVLRPSQGAQRPGPLHGVWHARSAARRPRRRTHVAAPRRASRDKTMPIDMRRWAVESHTMALQRRGHGRGDDLRTRAWERIDHDVRYAVAMCASSQMMRGYLAMRCVLARTHACERVCDAERRAARAVCARGLAGRAPHVRGERADAPWRRSPRAGGGGTG